MSATDFITSRSLVYFVQFGDAGPIKIGKSDTDSFPGRFGSLRGGSPVPLRCLGIVMYSDGFTESRLHLKFDRFRIQGEWFDPAPELLIFIETNAVPAKITRLRRNNNRLQIRLDRATLVDSEIQKIMPNGRPENRPEYIIDATPEFRAAILMVRDKWHPNDMIVALKRSKSHVRRLINQVHEFMDSNAEPSFDR